MARRLVTVLLVLTVFLTTFPQTASADFAKNVVNQINPVGWRLLRLGSSFERLTDPDSPIINVFSFRSSVPAATKASGLSKIIRKMYRFN